jgi:mannose-6-phosphate isomerase-like protein (cupin superfamily)
MPAVPLPPDDPSRALTRADPDDPALTHLAVVGDTYTVLVSTADTAGRYTLIDMLIPDGGGPPPHRHDFDEMFHVLDGAIEVTVRGETVSVSVGQTANIPANAPHSFHNRSGETVRLLCLASPGGLDEYFAEFGDPVASRTSPAPDLDAAAMGERMGRAKAAAARYGVDMMMPS